MKRAIILFAMLSFLLTSCGDNKYQKLIKEKKAFASYVSGSQKSVMNDFLSGSLGYLADKNISGNFYCLEKQDGQLVSYGDLNMAFRENGYACNYNNNLSYFIVVEQKEHAVGEYNNGGSAVKIETIVSLINIANAESAELFRKMGEEPPESIRSRPGAKNGGVGQHMHGKEIYNEIQPYLN